MTTISRFVSINDSIFAVNVDDGNGSNPASGSNGVTLTPIADGSNVDADTIQTGWYAVRTARMLASSDLRAVVSHPNSKFVGRKLTARSFTRFSNTGRYANLGSESVYVGEKKGASPLGWTLVHFTAS